MNMIKMAATGEFDGTNSAQSKTPEQGDFRYVWAPSNSQPEQSDYHSYLQSDDEFDFEQIPRGAGLHDSELPPAPFKFPEHDTVIKTARQLSSLASRQSSRAERIHHLQNMGEMGTSQQRNAYPEYRQHPRSASLCGPVPTGNFKSKSHRPRSRSANTPVGRRETEQYPPPPVKVSISKENIKVGTPNSARARLRYTSHWD